MNADESDWQVTICGEFHEEEVKAPKFFSSVVQARTRVLPRLSDLEWNAKDVHPSLDPLYKSTS